jgi:uncharacterized repeat protein (TIGR01451 family)
LKFKQQQKPLHPLSHLHGLLLAAFSRQIALIFPFTAATASYTVEPVSDSGDRRPDPQRICPPGDGNRHAATRSPLTLALLVTFWLPATAMALGTSAGIDISNSSTVDYSVSGSSGSVNSNTVTFRVDEKLDVNVTWQDAANVGVNTPDTNQILTFLLTNTGNGNDSFTLDVQNVLGGDQFDPVPVDIYLDTDGNGNFNAGVDTLYIPGTNDPVLGADASQTIFVRNNIPTGLNGGDLGNSQLTATSTTGSGVPGTSFANAGDNNTTALVGTSGGSSSAIGTYDVTNTTVALLKSVVISDPLGGIQPMPGATMTYSIGVSVTGPGTANGVVITDPIPANTTYTTGTLTLNAASLTDVVDGDAGDVGGTTPNTVTVDLGNLTAASPIQTITFEVIIN